MKTDSLYKFILPAIVILAVVNFSACQKNTGFVQAKAKPNAAGEVHHKAYHDGCLNAVVTCENGHAEVKLEGDLIRCWFVNGGNDTGRSVPIGETSISLSVTSDRFNGTRGIVLYAKPLSLAGETMGSCSYFEGQAIGSRA